METRCGCCDKQLGFFSRKIKIKDGLVCVDCASEAGLIKNRDHDDDFLMFTTDAVRTLRDQNRKLLPNFQHDRSIRDSKMDAYIQFNDEAKCFMIVKTMYCKDVYRYDQIYAFHLIDACGGGYCRNMRIKITLTDSPRSCVFIPLLRGQVATSSSVYTSTFATAHEITARLAVAKNLGRGRARSSTERPRNRYLT